MKTKCTPFFLKGIQRFKEQWRFPATCTIWPRCFYTLVFLTGRMFLTMHVYCFAASHTLGQWGKGNMQLPWHNRLAVPDLSGFKFLKSMF